MAVYRRSILWRLGCSPPARLWSGFGDLFIPSHSIDPTGATYMGAGALLQVPALKQLLNGIADRVEFQLSGVSAEAVRLALEDRETVRGADLHIGWIDFDAVLQVSGPPRWLWQGKADVLSVDRTESERTITLSAYAADADRANPVLAWWTDADQRRRSPTDGIMSHVAGLNAGSTRRWGPR